VTRKGNDKTKAQMNVSRLEQAIQFAIEHETPWSREPGESFGIHQLDPPPWNRLLGPVHARGPVSGTVRIDGKNVASWGEPARADLTFSIAKTYLALLAGVAHDRGLLPDVDRPVGQQLPGIGFDQGRNAQVTWVHLLQQTSEWEGEVFGMPDQVDRYRTLQFFQQDGAASGKKGDRRPLRAPGTYWEYNDVRINQLSLALLHLFRRPLPEVFRESVTRPVGASETWRWLAYDNAWVEIDGRRMQSVPGGTHWGGGISISSEDQALIGQLLLDDGRVRGRQVISRQWIQRMKTPSPVAPFYGFLLWLNNGRLVFPSVPDSSCFAIGAGSSYTWIEPEHRMVLVVRWIDSVHADEFFARVLEALEEKTVRKPVTRDA
jgi:CubicO group peptidase (beta-lactamase class C family)